MIIDILNGWFAYVLTTNSGVTFIFAGVLFFTAIILVLLQLKDDEFDFRAIISEYRDGHYVPVTAKTLLVGCWLVSTYLTVAHYTETALTAYLGFWVLNGGVAAWSKMRDATTAPKKAKPVKEET